MLAGVLSERWGWGRWDGDGMGIEERIGLDWGFRRRGVGWGKDGSFVQGGAGQGRAGQQAGIICVVPDLKLL